MLVTSCRQKDTVMTRRVVLITDCNLHLGPDLARKLAARDHDLILGDPLPGLVGEVEALGADVVALIGTSDIVLGEGDR